MYHFASRGGKVTPDSGTVAPVYGTTKIQINALIVNVKHYH